MTPKIRSVTSDSRHVVVPDLKSISSTRKPKIRIAQPRSSDSVWPKAKAHRATRVKALAKIDDDHALEEAPIAPHMILEVVDRNVPRRVRGCDMFSHATPSVCGKREFRVRTA